MSRSLLGFTYLFRTSDMSGQVLLTMYDCYGIICDVSSFLFYTDLVYKCAVYFVMMLGCEGLAIFSARCVN